MALLVYLFAMIVWSEAAHAQQREEVSEKDSSPALSCDEFLPERKQVGEKSVGPEECRIVSEEVVSNVNGHKFQRLELRISGTLEGWVAKNGPRFDFFNDAPDIVFTQFGNTAPRFKGVGRYAASTGHGVSLFIPESPAHWNGKLFVTVHGSSPYGPVGTLLPRNPDADFNPLANANRYVGLMLDRGYAVAHTLRSSPQAGGDISVTLDDGTILPKNSVSTHAGLITEFTKIAANLLQRKLGRKSARTYFYGFSSGGFIGRLIQYQPGFNNGDDGRPLFDGFLIDDAGWGMPRPVLMVDGRDALFAGDDRKRFVHQIDITHQLYLGDTKDYLIKKRDNAEILKDKGLADKHRMYEIRGVSHFDAGQTSLHDLVPQTLDLGGLVASLLDTLDRWVEKDEEPPPTKSDLLELGAADRDNAIENPAIALPEIACPSGVHHTYPLAHGTTRRGLQETAFAAFDGINLEPLDGRGELVDMNGNGVRDKRETVAQAWARLGLLKPGERLTRGKYIACVAKAAAKLVEQGLLPSRLLPYYVNRAAASGVGEAER